MRNDKRELGVGLYEFAFRCKNWVRWALLLLPFKKNAPFYLLMAHLMALSVANTVISV
jgi:hypothetical protein